MLGVLLWLPAAVQDRRLEGILGACLVLVDGQALAALTTKLPPGLLSCSRTNFRFVGHLHPPGFKKKIGYMSLRDGLQGVRLSR